MQPRNENEDSRSGGHPGDIDGQGDTEPLLHSSQGQASTNQEDEANRNPTTDQNPQSDASTYDPAQRTQDPSSLHEVSYYWHAVLRTWTTMDTDDHDTAPIQALDSNTPPSSSTQYEHTQHEHTQHEHTQHEHTQYELTQHELTYRWLSSADQYPYVDDYNLRQPLQPQPPAGNDIGSLTLSNLQQLDSIYAPTSNMAMWMSESQQESAWNGVGYVRMERDEKKDDIP